MLIRSFPVLWLALSLAAADAAPKKKPKTTDTSRVPAKAKRTPAAKKAKAKRAPAAKRAKAKRPRRRARRRARGARCRDIFCTAQIVRMDGSGETKGLNEQQVEKVATTAQKPLEPCLVHARRRDPNAVKARVEVVVDRRGRILASRVNGRRWSPLARCVHRKLRAVRFPKTDVRRQVAAFTIAIPN